MTDFKHYFDGTKGTAVSGYVKLPVLVSDERSNTLCSPLSFYYTDDFFLKSACSYNHAMAQTSLGLTMAAFTSRDKSDTAIREALQDIGCDGRTIKCVKFDDNSPTDDTCAYAFGLKHMDDFHVLPVVIRSHRYGGEWVSNAHVFSADTPDFSVGFKTAADNVYDALMRYIDERRLDRRHLKVWICGYSRGAAVSNLLGARLNEESGIGKDNIYVYTFATPRTVQDSRAAFTDNIFNIISETDCVPRLPPESWGFTRYGTDLYLPCSSRRGIEVAAEMQEKMRLSFNEVMAEMGLEDIEYTVLEEQEKAIDLLLDYIDDLLTTPEKYADEGYQAIVMEFLRTKVGVADLDLRKFLRFLLSGHDDMADDFCLLFEQWNELKPLDKAARISSLDIKFTGMLAKHVMGVSRPATEIVSAGLGIFMRYATKTAANKMTHGSQDFYYEQLIKMFIDCFHNGAESAILMQHWPEVYLAWLRSGDEGALFRTDSYMHSSIK